jgi:dTDP-4-dehydrorhamnose reductase
MPSWLVTGSNGFLGANAGYFLADEIDRIGLVRQPSASSTFPRQVVADLLDSDSLRDAVQSTRPNVILHCAALASHEDCEADPALARRMNVDATRTLAQAAASVGSTFIYVSTDSVFDGDRGNYCESDEPNPFSVYGETKLLGEAAAMEACADTLVVRTNFFGWSTTGTRSILEFFVNALRDGRRINGYTDYVVSSIYAGQLISLIQQLATLAHRGIVHVGSADALSKHAFGLTVANGFGLPADLISPASAADSGQGTSRARNLSLDTALVASLLGTPLPTQARGIRAACDDEQPVRAALQSGENRA